MADDHAVVYRALQIASQNGEAAALATVVETQGSIPRHAGSKMLVYADGTFVGTIGGGAMESRVIADARQAIQTQQSRMVSYSLTDMGDGDPGICGGTARIFVEPLSVAPCLVVVGGGHVGKAVAELGKWLQYRVILSDDRPEFCNPEYLPGLEDYVVCPPSEVTQHVTLDANCYVAAVTRGLPVDLDLIPALLESDAAYIGLIGSRRRWQLTANAIREQGNITGDQLKRIHAPIGLELEAETPKEIALSIMAEIVMLRRGGTGQPMAQDG